MFALLLLIPIALIIFGLVKLVSGKSKIDKNEFDSPEYKVGKKELKVGINIFIVISVLLIIGFSLCFSMVAGF